LPVPYVCPSAREAEGKGGLLPAKSERVRGFWNTNREGTPMIWAKPRGERGRAQLGKNVQRKIKPEDHSPTTKIGSAKYKAARAGMRGGTAIRLNIMLHQNIVVNKSN